MTKRKVVLENGQEFIGEAFGGSIPGAGEVVFHTGMTGYQEIISDPNYFGKIVVMTYPSIGNYGINRDDVEAIRSSLAGLIVKELCEKPSNFRSEETVHGLLEKEKIPGISGIDTRMLTRIIQQEGMMKGILIDIEETDQDMGTIGNSDVRQMLEQVSIAKPYIIPGRGKRIVVIDFGVKQSILRELTEYGCYLIVVPYFFTKEDIATFKPDGVLISNGPGNPNEMPSAIQTVTSLLGTIPLFGIGLGHELISLAYGASVEQLPVGHFGVSFPVKDLQRDHTWTVSKSSAFTVTEATLPKKLKVTHRSLHDGSVEGIMHEQDNVLSVQFHPEGAPGPTELNVLFQTFLQTLHSYERNGGTYHA